jgi:hypothetical protein
MRVCATDRSVTAQIADDFLTRLAVLPQALAKVMVRLALTLLPSYKWHVGTRLLGWRYFVKNKTL